MTDMEMLNYEEALPPPYALILIGIIPEPRDMEIARLLGWYRIPIRFAPKVVRVDFIAFFQPSSFGNEHSGRIETFAEVLGVELSTRAELIKNEPDHPRAFEEYYKIQIGPVKTLKTPIFAGAWKRITFLYTTGELFARAKKVQDLVVRTEERKILWHSLREKAFRSQEYDRNELPEIDLDPEILMMLGDLSLLDDTKEWYQSS